MEDFYIMKKRNKIVAFLLAGVIAAGHGSVVYAAGYGSVVYEDVAWDLCALNEERMKLEVQEKNTDNDAAEAIARGSAYAIRLVEPIPEREICLVTNSSTQMSAAVRKVISFL